MRCTISHTSVQNVLNQQYVRNRFQLFEGSDNWKSWLSRVYDDRLLEQISNVKHMPGWNRRKRRVRYNFQATNYEKAIRKSKRSRTGFSRHLLHLQLPSGRASIPISNPHNFGTEAGGWVDISSEWKKNPAADTDGKVGIRINADRSRRVVAAWNITTIRALPSG